MKEFKPWNQTVLYQAYPWSFNEDEQREPQLGNGSVRGLTEKLSYLIELGVDAVWVSPPYTGPMKDAGYDISNFTDIHPELGALDDFDVLVEECHNNGIRVMLDFIPNHSSDQHEWFDKSRNKEPGFEDYYIWQPGKLDSKGNHVPPNNWPSVFSKPNRVARDQGKMPWLKDNERTPPISAWQWDDVRGEYYLRTFVKEQPDLNWKNEKVANAMLDSMRFWLDRGVDGFRMDAVNHLAKNHDFPDERVNDEYNEDDYNNPLYSFVMENSGNYMPEYHRLMDLFLSVVRDKKYDGRDIRLLIESYMDEPLLHEINDIDPEKATTFNFGAFRMDWNATKRKQQMDHYYKNINKKGLPNQVHGNHDNPRLATRIGDGAARAAAVMNLFLPGMRIIYSGEELGLHDGVVPADRVQDPNGLRDGARTPIIWDDTKPNAGFSNADPKDTWLPINEDDLELSVTRQQRDPKSSLALYEAAIRLCNELPAVAHGAYVPIDTDNVEVLAYGRRSDGNDAVVVVNFSELAQTVMLDTNFALGRVVLSSIDVLGDLKEVDLDDGVNLRPNEAIVVVPA